MAQTNARSCTPGSPWKALGEMICGRNSPPLSDCVLAPGGTRKALTPFLIVLAVRPPTETAPANSMMEAASAACFMVRDLDATDVANELATSLAPML